MLWIIFSILSILWLFGLLGGYTIGDFVYVLLLMPIVVVMIRVIQGKPPVI
jgi:hypothetical protein